MLFVFKSIEYRKQQCVSSDRSDQKCMREKDIPLGDYYLKWPFSQNTLFSSQDLNIFSNKTVIKLKGQCLWMGYFKRSPGKANFAY